MPGDVVYHRLAGLATGQHILTRSSGGRVADRHVERQDTGICGRSRWYAMACHGWTGAVASLSLPLAAPAVLDTRQGLERRRSRGRHTESRMQRLHHRPERATHGTGGIDRLAAATGAARLQGRRVLSQAVEGCEPGKQQTQNVRINGRHDVDPGQGPRTDPCRYAEPGAPK